jgi:heptosyltransferase II
MKILIELPSWLGDTVMATPAIENIIEHFEEAEIALIGPLISIELFKFHPKISSTYKIEKKFKSLFRFSKDLEGFDNFFSFRSSSRSKIFKLLIDSSNKYQFNKKKYKRFHQVEKYSNFINDCLGESFLPGKLKIYKNESYKAYGQKKTLGINPGASFGSAKRWQTDKFAEVILDLSDDYEIIIFGGPGEIDIARDIENKILSEGVKNYHNLAGKTSIEDLINKISSLSLFVTGDSGPMHLAASFEIPTVSIFGPTNDNETAQWSNDKSIIIKNNLICQPCMKRTCPLGHNNCMSQIKSDKVIDALNSFS